MQRWLKDYERVIHEHGICQQDIYNYLFCPYYKHNEIDACYENSFMTYLDKMKVKMYPHILPGADTLVIFYL